MNNKYFSNKRIAICIFWMLIGICLILLVFTHTIPSDIWSGMGVGLIAVGIGQLYKQIRYRRDPDYRRKMDIECSDERKRYLQQRAWSVTGYVCVIAASLVSLLALLMGKKVISEVLLLVVAVEALVYCITYFIIGKRN